MSSETGSIGFPKNTRIGQVAQEAPGTEDALIEIVLKADVERTALMAEAAHVVPPIGAQGLNMSLADLGALLDLACARQLLARTHDQNERPASHGAAATRTR